MATKTCEILEGRTIAIVSRCSWTLFNFRSSLIRELMANGSRVVAFGGSGDGFERRLVESHIDFRPVTVSRRGLSPVADLRLIFELIAEFRRTRPAIVHCFTVKPAIYGTIAAWLARVPVRIVTITGLGHAFTSARPWLNRLVSVLYRIALRRAHFTYFQNAEDRELFVARRLIVPENAGVIAGSGVDTAHFSLAPLPISVTGSVPKFLMIARLVREKGVLEFVAAANEVKVRFPRAEFQLLGGADSRNPSALRPDEVASLQASSPVRWLGGTADVRPFISAADVIVLPSYREGLPRVLVEAASMGRPAIATNTTGCRDVIVDKVTGYLVPMKDARALAEAMCRFIERPTDIESMGAAARARVLELFDEEAVIRETLKRYAGLFAQNAGDTDATTAA